MANKNIKIESKNDFDSYIKDFNDRVENLHVKIAIPQVLTLFKESKFNEALDILLPLQSKFEDEVYFKENQNFGIYSFNNELEFIMFCFSNQISEKNIVWVGIFHKIYMYLAYIYNEFKDYTKAKYSLQKAIEWNPVGMDIWLEYADTLLRDGSVENYLLVIHRCFQYATTPNELATCYRKIGYYYIEKKQYELAIAIYQHSLRFDKNEIALNELAYIKHIIGDQFHTFNEQEIIQILKDSHIPLEIDILAEAAYLKILESMEDGKGVDNRNRFIHYMENWINMLISEEKQRKLMCVKIPDA